MNRSRAIRHQNLLFKSGRHRRGAAALDVVMSTAVTVPLVIGLLFLGMKMCGFVYSLISGLTSWPFL